MRKALQSIPLYHRAVLELVFAGSIWGASFTFSKWALVDFSASALVFWRFFIAIVIGEILMLAFQRKHYRRSLPDFKIAIFAGIGLGGSLILQTYGLKFTTATNSSFITSLYVVMIPFASYLFYRSQVYWYHFFLSAIAFIGMGFLLNLSQTAFKFNIGDLVTLGAAVTSTFHIIAVGFGSKKAVSGFRFNIFQTFWAWVLVLPFLGYETMATGGSLFPQLSSYRSIVAIVCLALFVSLGAFYLQIRSQKILSNTTASMLCLLEAPYSFIFATVFLQEKLTPWQFFGAGLILASSLISVYVDRPQDGSP